MKLPCELCGRAAWMVDLIAKLPSGREVRFRKRKIPTKGQARALEAKVSVR